MSRRTASTQRQLRRGQRRTLRQQEEDPALPPPRCAQVNIGKAGLTERFLLGLLDAQAGNDYVKVRAPHAPANVLLLVLP